MNKTFFLFAYPSPSSIYFNILLSVFLKVNVPVIDSVRETLTGVAPPPKPAVNPIYFPCLLKKAVIQGLILRCFY